MLATVWSMEKCRQFVWGTKFILRTDHKPLLKVLTSEGVLKATPRIAKMNLKLLDFTYEVEYLPGKRNQVADYLSISPLPYETPERTDWDDFNVAFVYDSTSAITKDEWDSEYSHDEVLGKAASFITQGWPGKNESQGQLRAMWEIQNKLSIDIAGNVCRGERIIVPTTLRSKVLEINHEGHLGILKLKARIKMSYWWPGMDRDIEKFIRQCSICQDADKTQWVLRPTLGTRLLPDQPWESLSIDWLGPFDDEEGNHKHILVVIDDYSKWPEIQITENFDTKQIHQFSREFVSARRNSQKHS